MPAVLITNPARRPSKRRNPRRRHHHHAKAAAPRRRRNPSIFKMHTRHRRRRNPSGLGSGAGAMIKESLIAGGGAFALDVGWGFVKPMLGTIATGLTYNAVKAAGTIALAHMFRNSKMASQALRGSLVVQTYVLISQTIGGSLTLGGRGGMGGYVATAGQNPKLRPGAVPLVPNARVTAMPRSGVAGRMLVTQVAPNRAQIYR